VGIVPVGSIKVFMDSEAVVFWNVCRLNSRACRDVVAKLVSQERSLCFVFNRPSCMTVMML
jgi:hypothetical protein